MRLAAGCMWCGVGGGGVTTCDKAVCCVAGAFRSFQHPAATCCATKPITWLCVARELRPSLRPLRPASLLGPVGPGPVGQGCGQRVSAASSRRSACGWRGEPGCREAAEPEGGNLGCRQRGAERRSCLSGGGSCSRFLGKGNPPSPAAPAWGSQQCKQSCGDGEGRGPEHVGWGRKNTEQSKRAAALRRCSPAGELPGWSPSRWDAAGAGGDLARCCGAAAIGVLPKLVDAGVRQRRPSQERGCCVAGDFLPTEGFVTSSDAVGPLWLNIAQCFPRRLAGRSELPCHLSVLWQRPGRLCRPDPTAPLPAAPCSAQRRPSLRWLPAPRPGRGLWGGPVPARRDSQTLHRVAVSGCVATGTA